MAELGSNEICGNGKYPQEIILRALIAHEVGHVLLGTNSHAPRGIMSAMLSPADLRLAISIPAHRIPR
jgi:hypothetical protein